MVLTTKKLLANNAYFKTIVNTTKIYIWQSEALVFTITDKKFVCDTMEKKRAMKKCTTKSFYHNNTIT